MKEIKIYKCDDGTTWSDKKKATDHEVQILAKKIYIIIKKLKNMKMGPEYQLRLSEIIVLISEINNLLKEYEFHVNIEFNLYEKE